MLATIFINCLNNLCGQSERERFADLDGFVDKVGSFYLGVKFHCTILIKLVTEMIRAGHKRKLSSIQYQALRIITAVSVPTHIKAFRFKLFKNISGELDVVVLSVSFADG